MVSNNDFSNIANGVPKLSPEMFGYNPVAGNEAFGNSLVKSLFDTIQQRQNQNEQLNQFMLQRLIPQQINPLQQAQALLDIQRTKNLQNPQQQNQYITGVDEGGNVVRLDLGSLPKGSRNQTIIPGVSFNPQTGESTQTSAFPKGVGQILIPSQNTQIPNTPNTKPSGIFKSVLGVKQTTQPLTTQQQVDKSVQEDIQKKNAEQKQSLSDLNDTINLLEKKLSDIPAGTGIKGMLSGLGMKGMAITPGLKQLTPKVTAYNDLTNGLRMTIVQLLGGAKRVAVPELNYIASLIPSIDDVDEMRSQKLQNLRDYIGIRTNPGGLSTDKINTILKIHPDIPVNQIIQDYKSGKFQ